MQGPFLSRREWKFVILSATIVWTGVLHMTGIHNANGQLVALVRGRGWSPNEMNREYRTSQSHIFLNVYLNPQNPSNGLKIVQEQLGQVREALGEDSYSLHYTLIGANTNGSLCNKTDHAGVCSMLNHFQRANEEVTLSELHKHCRENPNDVVTYLHNKGSFHSSLENNRLRRMNTKAALSNECRSIGRDDMTCNVCSLVFQSFPHSHVCGNMWTAKCDYIQGLVSPLEYESWRREMCRTVVTSYQKQSFCPPSVENITDSRDHGLGRFAMERWIASHPRMTPCEVFRNAPMRLFSTGWETWIPNRTVAKKEHRRFTDLQRSNLQMQVHEYTFMYGAKEPTSGFCENYFSKLRGNPCPRPHEVFLNATIDYRMKKKIE